MEPWGPSTYGDLWAATYDDWIGDRLETAAAVDFLAGRAGAGPVLELAIGTGRVALPLAARGIDVHGVDASEAMVARLRAKPGGAAIPVAIGDFAEVPVDGPYGLIYVVFNTLFALLSQEAQVRCFANVTPRLSPGGRFVIEAFVPDLSRFRLGQALHAANVEMGRVISTPPGTTRSTSGSSPSTWSSRARASGCSPFRSATPGPPSST